MSHTPGPWAVYAWGAYADHAVVVIDSHDEQVATTSDLLKSWDECEANACLVAAAPEMYALLRKFEDTHDTHVLHSSIVQPLLAKAEGRCP